MLYTVGAKKLILAKYVKEWFKEYYKELIATSGYVEFHVRRPFRERVTLVTSQAMFPSISSASSSTAQTSHRQLKKERVQIMSELTIAQVLAQGQSSTLADDSPEHCSSSLESDKVEINEDNLSAVLSYVDRGKTSKLAEEVVAQYSKDNKKRKKELPNNTNTSSGPNK